MKVNLNSITTPKRITPKNGDWFLLLDDNKYRLYFCIGNVVVDIERDFVFTNDPAGRLAFDDAIPVDVEIVVKHKGVSE